MAIRWAVELAKLEEWDVIVVESDAKLYIDALILDSSTCHWRICAIRLDILALAICFLFLVRREAAHALAKLIPLLNPHVAYFPYNLPHPLEEAWFKDFCCTPFLV